MGFWNNTIGYSCLGVQIGASYLISLKKLILKKREKMEHLSME
jgi:hypothetical protein